MASSIVVFNGSPRQGGNTDAILEKLIEGAGPNAPHIRYFKLRELEIHNCIGCCTCKMESRCHFDDDMIKIHRSIQKCDLMVFASPIYWCEITGLMKTFMDRLYFYHHPENSHLISGKKAVLLTTMGEKDNVDYESQILVEFYRRVFKSLNVDILDMLFFSDLMEKEAFLKKPEYLERSLFIGKRLSTNTRII
jgi:multimeric flavodoxin WrbA